MKGKRKIISISSFALWAFVLLAAAPSNAVAQTCGNGQVDPGEQCDNGGQSGGCCTAQCTFAPADAACNDGNPNTIDSCNASGVCVGRYQTTTCGACRDPNNAQDTSYCDLTTNQCVRQTADCPPFFVEADGSRNLCQPNYGRDPATGQCLYRAKFRAPTGCLNEACNPSTGEFELVTDDQKAIACGGNNNLCAPLPEGCPQNECRYQSCSPAAEPQNCALSVPNNCYATNPSTCQEGVPANAPQNISAGSCQQGNGCIFTATACAPPSNPCEVLVRDGNAVGCCTYRPRDCAAEFGNNPNFTYSCDPTATNGVCKATPNAAPEICDGLDNDLDGMIDEGFANTDGDALADCVDPDDDNDNVSDAADNCPLTANANQADFDRDGKGDVCDAQTGPPRDAEQCKNNGFRRFDFPRTFRNQGDCIEFVNTGK